MNKTDITSLILQEMTVNKEYSLDEIHKFLWKHGIILTDCSLRNYLVKLKQEKTLTISKRKVKTPVGQVPKLFYYKVEHVL